MSTKKEPVEQDPNPEGIKDAEDFRQREAQAKERLRAGQRSIRDRISDAVEKSERGELPQVPEVSITPEPRFAVRRTGEKRTDGSRYIDCVIQIPPDEVEEIGKALAARKQHRTVNTKGNEGVHDKKENRVEDMKSPVIRLICGERALPQPGGKYLVVGRASIEALADLQRRGGPTRAAEEISNNKELYKGLLAEEWIKTGGIGKNKGKQVSVEKLAEYIKKILPKVLKSLIPES